MTKIKTVEDLKKAFSRLDEIFDIPVDDPRRDERAALIDAVEKYEDEHCHIQPPTEEEARAFRREQELIKTVETLDNRGIRITYRKHYGFRPHDLDGWLEELRKEKR
jgi:hypothetical protein